jgi:hypothetical protein
LAVSAGAAAPGGVALVIGNGAYDYLPPLPACPESAREVGAALRGAGFDVSEKEDVSSGEMEAALIDFAHRLGATPASGALIYVCGYAGDYDGRDFLLPVSAAVAHPSDLLAQGLLAKSLLNTMAEADQGSGLLLIDAVAYPGAEATLGFGALKQASLPERIGVAAAIEAKPDAAPTPIARALVSALKTPDIEISALLADLTHALPPGSGVSLAANRPPTATALLEAPSVRSKPAPPATPPIATPPVASAANPPAVGATSPPLPAPVAPASEAAMSDAERRRVQIALAQLGYYSDRIDGVFGPGTRAAIRRFQHEIKANMTGVLTPAETSRLLAAAR